MKQQLISLWKNRWIRLVVVSVVYILWFVVWTRNPWWLIGLPFIFDHYVTRYLDRLVLDRYRAYKERHPAFRKGIDWVESLLYAVVVVLPLKTYFFGMYVIPSPSMETTLMTGDYIFVSKLPYGPKMPNTPISFPFVQNTMPLTRDTPSFVDWIEWPYKRLRGTDQVRRGDVVVFNFPEGDTVALANPTGNYYEWVRSEGRQQVAAQSEIIYRPVDKRENYIKRCMALPGDTLQVVEGRVVVNGVEEPEIAGRQYIYVVSVSEPFSSKILERLGISRENVSYLDGRYTLPLTDKGVEQLRSLPQVTEIIRYTGLVPGDEIFPHQPLDYPWSVDSFGPLWIPRAGATVQLTPANLPLYQRIIKNYEGNTLETQGDTILINGEPATSYTFRMNYYFMMGDNRHNSADSRYWGFVPEDHIEGKATLIWFSLTPEKNIFNGIRWDRIFNRIH